MLKGNVPAALEMLKKIEDKHPGLYATAANLGTCYELFGDDETAPQWIEEGLRRNPYSHMLAEWLHVRMLQVMGQRLYEAATFMLDSRANAIEAALALAMKYGLPPQRARDLQLRADGVLENSAVLGRPSALGI